MQTIEIICILVVSVLIRTSLAPLLLILRGGLICLFIRFGSLYYRFIVIRIWLDSIAASLLILRVLVCYLTTSTTKVRFKRKKLLWLTQLMLIVLLLAFTSNNVLQFYAAFEISLIPIILMISGWGYQPERITAIYFILLYTITASLPLLVWILTVSSMGSTFSSLALVPIANSGYLTLKSLVLITGFLVKFPIFAFHLWLPKAHVEAPLVGSIILAAILLKLGGFGIWRCLTTLINSSWTLWVQSVSLTGGALIALVCIRQNDIKVLIAYSSVAHIRIVIAALSSQTNYGAWGALALIVAHGVASSAIFKAADSIYQLNHTRRLVLTAGILGMAPYLTLIIFICCLGRIGAPPTINLLREIICINRLVGLSLCFIAPLILLTFFAAAYSLVFYASSQQGQSNLLVCPSSANSRTEQITLMLHCLWLLEGLIVIL